MATSQTTVSDVTPLRERGGYQDTFDAVSSLPTGSLRCIDGLLNLGSE